MGNCLEGFFNSGRTQTQLSNQNQNKQQYRQNRESRPTTSQNHHSSNNDKGQNNAPSQRGSLKKTDDRKSVKHGSNNTPHRPAPRPKSDMIPHTKLDDRDTSGHINKHKSHDHSVQNAKLSIVNEKSTKNLSGHHQSALVTPLEISQKNQKHYPEPNNTEGNHNPHTTAATKPENSKTSDHGNNEQRKPKNNFVPKNDEKLNPNTQSHEHIQSDKSSNEINTTNLSENHQMHHQTILDGQFEAPQINKDITREEKKSGGDHHPHRTAPTKLENSKNKEQGNLSKKEKPRAQSEYISKNKYNAENDRRPSAGHISKKTGYKYDPKIDEEINFNISSLSKQQAVQNDKVNKIDERDPNLHQQDPKLVPSFETPQFNQGDNFGLSKPNSFDEEKLKNIVDGIISKQNIENLNNQHHVSTISHSEKKISDQENSHERKIDGDITGQGVADKKDDGANIKDEEKSQEPITTEEKIKTPDEEHQIPIEVKPADVPVEGGKEELSPEKKLALEQIDTIKSDITSLLNEVIKFSGPDTDKDYIYLDEMLTRNLLKLDNVETNGDKEIRNKRREAIKYNHVAISQLKQKVEDYNQKRKKNPSDDTKKNKKTKLNSE